ncbi:DUF5085 family protein [Staphylococcus epidermidis]|uniref:DUF5085 family protein n=2 Tax=Bacilli TaxID=91061 RepID=UPI000E075731|nr:DUF5085 family protein [Staphylococcus epidermidis]SUM27545.1 Uncharacterised protein [Staphylococcus epidermidis]
MELDVLIMPHIAKMEFSIHPDYWKDEMKRIKEFFVSNDIYTMGPTIFNKEIVGMGEVNFITYIPLNDEIEEIPELNIKYQPTLEVYPTISHKCFDEDDFEVVYEGIQTFASENDITLSDKPFYHVMSNYFGGEIYEIHAEINIDEVELDE